MTRQSDRQPDKQLDRFGRLLEFHSKHPDIDFDTWALPHSFKLADRALAHHRIYLDQNYWNYCRDASIDRPQRSAHARIWELLSTLADRSVVCCPAHEAVFSEMARLSDRSIRNLSRVIDRLSQGLSISDWQHRTALEVSHYAWSKLIPNDHSLKPLESRVWCSHSHFVGVPQISLDDLSPAQELAMQKAVFDEQAGMSVEVLCSDLSVFEPEPRDSSHYDAVNLQSRLTRPRFQTYRDLFRTEIAGTADLMVDDFEPFCASLLAQDVDLASIGGGATAREVAINLAAHIVAGFKLGRISDEIPSWHISASLHAAIRYKRMPLKIGDYEDFRHANAAIPYCDAFFTEKKLAHLIAEPPLAMDALYDCSVLYKPDDIISYLEQLS